MQICALVRRCNLEHCVLQADLNENVRESALKDIEDKVDTMIFNTTRLANNAPINSEENRKQVMNDLNGAVTDLVKRVVQELARRARVEAAGADDTGDVNAPDPLNGVARGVDDKLLLLSTLDFQSFYVFASQQAWVYTKIAEKLRPVEDVRNKDAFRWCESILHAYTPVKHSCALHI
jgi:hypothetical protein